MNKSYNERLFGKDGFRKKLHLSRFFWLEKQLLKLMPEVSSVVELGCFDARSVFYLPKGFKRYVGYDADWEDGIALATSQHKTDERIQIIECKDLSDFTAVTEKFDISISLETLEHLKVSDLEDYIKALNVKTNNLLIVTVPNEKGLLAVSKYLVKKFVYKHTYDYYSMRELFWVLLGRLNKIERKEFAHKGFDYQNLINIISEHFTIIKVEGIPFKFLPKSLNFTIGIVAKPK